MDLNKLQSFCRVYEFASFSRAAQELFLSQPTISAHVHSLELELETLLFDRNDLFLRLGTSKGIIFRQHTNSGNC